MLSALTNYFVDAISRVRYETTEYTGTLNHRTKEVQPELFHHRILYGKSGAYYIAETVAETTNMRMRAYLGGTTLCLFLPVVFRNANELHRMVQPCNWGS